MKCLFLILFVLAMHQCVSGKTLTRCGLAKELKRQGFAVSTIRNWVCLVEAESGRRTDAKGGPNSNGSYDWGLFQINDKYWCTRTGSAGKDCNVKCSDLMTDDITKASKCAMLIYKRHGFNAWYGWKAKCQGALPNISSCGI